MRKEDLYRAKLLREMSSAEARDWFLENYPFENGEWWKHIHLLRHLSLRSQDQIALAGAYLQNLPHASDRVYKIFLSFMRIDKFLAVVIDNFPEDPSGMDLLNYYLIPSLREAATTEKQISIIEKYNREYA